VKRLFASIIPLCVVCCATAPPPPEPVAEKLEPYLCPAGEFLGFGIGETEGEALSVAHSELAKQINSSVKVTSERTVSQQMLNGNENLSSAYGTRSVIESSLANAQDARVAYKKHSGGKTGITVCISKADAAKPYIQRQSLLQDSLEFTATNALNSTHPRQKSEARGNANLLWAKILANNDLLKGWGIASDISRAKDLHDAVEDSFKDYCQTARLHWNPRQETLYSEIAFSKLSNGVKMEKSPCTGNGISLAYGGSEPECSVEFGLNTCSYAQSLSVNSCDGTEYMQLKNDAMGAHQKADFALEKLRGNLKSAEFWEQWAREIKQWSPKCE
jgi:hypothetical protein